MDISILFQPMNPTPWKIYIPFYFYFTGLSAGSFILSSLSTVFGMKQFKPVAYISAILAFVLLLIAPAMLILDLGHPFRFMNVLNPAYFNPRSPMSYGSWLLTIYPIATLVYIWFMSRPEDYPGKDRKLKIIGAITIPLAIAVHAYTGFVFGVVKAKVLWNTALMPGYFLTSAILSGIGLLAIVYIIMAVMKNKKPDSALLKTLKNYMIGIILLDLFWVISIVLVMLMGTESARLAINMMLHDPIYLFVEIGFGMLLPLLILLIPSINSRPSWIMISSVCVLIGVFAMRYTVVFGGIEAARLGTLVFQ
jgi:Ni/Fe-hydrogenase subunit HybB-like protein